MNAEPEFCPAKLACDARIAELEAELADLRDISDAWGYYGNLLADARHRLAAVIAAMEIWQRGDDPDGWSPEALIRSIRAAATGGSDG